MLQLYQKFICTGFRRHAEDCGTNLSGVSVLQQTRQHSAYFQGHKKQNSTSEEPIELGYSERISNTSSSYMWLKSIAPCFMLDASKISIITEPSKFYEVLLERSKQAKCRITLASLYLGTGSLEKKLVSSIAENLECASGKLKVKVLLDFARGSRGDFNSRHMLLPLLEKYHQHCQVALYHTPALRGPLRSLLPPRYSELIGLQHMKIYVFDDSLLISGANLSEDYFTNRQDRYILVDGCQPLADFYDALVDQVSKFSLQLGPSNQVRLHSKWTIHPFKGHYEDFVSAARASILRFLSNAMHSTSSVPQIGDTCLYPLVEMGQLGVKQDSHATCLLLESQAPGSTVHLATGYFNLTPAYMASIVQRSTASYSILMAHPTANGFLGAPGPAGGIPAAYRQLAAAFMRQVQSSGQGSRVQLLEYYRPGWTYHAKGLWYTPPGHTLPSLSLIGSSNFGSRSVHRDLETQIVIETTSDELKKSLKREQENLYSRGIPFTDETVADSDQTTPLWVRTAIKLFRNYF